MASYQYGFRPGRSTLDALIKLGTDVKKALAMKEVLVAVYFDIEKSIRYDVERRIAVKVAKNGN